MLKNLRGFSNTKLAGVLIAIIIVPFVFWGMGSVFSGGNTNNLAKINNKPISTQDFIEHVNQSRINIEYVKKNLENNVIEEILTGLVSNKLLEMEIDDLDASISENALANKIKKDKKFSDENNGFSRLKYEKFLLENNITAPYYEIRFKDQELKKNLFDYVSGGIKSPYFLKNKIYSIETKELEIEYFDLNIAYNLDTSKIKLDAFISSNEDNLKEEFIDIKYAKLTPQNLIQASEFNDDFFKKIDEIENTILNGSAIDEIEKEFKIDVVLAKEFINHNSTDELLNEIYSKRNEDKIQLIDKNDFYLLYEISNKNKILPDVNNASFVEKVKDQLILKQKYEYNQELFKKIQNKELDDKEFLDIANGSNNIEKLTINSINFNEKFSRDSINLLYSLPKGSFVLIADKNNNVFLSKISKINLNKLSRNDELLKDYALKSNSQIIGEIYSTYDLSLNEKYNVKLFQNTIERVKNNFR